MLMVLVSLSVASLVVLAVLLTTLQCMRVKRMGRRLTNKETGGGSVSASDSDYSSYSGDDDEPRLEDTVFSEPASSVTSPPRPQPPPRSRRRVFSTSSDHTSNSFLTRHLLPPPQSRFSPPPSFHAPPLMTSFRQQHQPELLLRPDPLMSSYSRGL